MLLGTIGPILIHINENYILIVHTVSGSPHQNEMQLYIMNQVILSPVEQEEQARAALRKEVELYVSK